MDAQAKEAGLGIGRVRASVELLEAEFALRSDLRASRPAVAWSTPIALMSSGPAASDGRDGGAGVLPPVAARARAEGQSHQRPRPE